MKDRQKGAELMSQEMRVHPACFDRTNHNNNNINKIKLIPYTKYPNDARTYSLAPGEIYSISFSYNFAVVYSSLHAHENGLRSEMLGK